MQVNKIELPKELTEETALEFIGNIASVCVGKFNQFDKERCEKIGRKNLTESLGKPTRAWEFLPIRFAVTETYPNFRGGLNAEITFSSLLGLYVNDTFKAKKDFHIFHLRIPRFVRDHIKTHQTLSSLCESVRLGDPNTKVEFYFPKIEKENGFFKSLLLKPLRKKIDNMDGMFFYNFFTSLMFKILMKQFYKRKEIWNRPLSDFVMSDMLICGYSDAWEHFINVRTDKTTQKETRMIAEMIKEQL